MDDKQGIEVRKEIYTAISKILSVALSVAEENSDRMLCKCECGKTEHAKDSKHCAECGKKLEEAAGDGSL